MYRELSWDSLTEWWEYPYLTLRLPASADEEHVAGQHMDWAICEYNEVRTPKGKNIFSRQVRVKAANVCPENGRQEKLLRCI
jgi:hypothetical protein